MRGTFLMERGKHSMSIRAERISSALLMEGEAGIKAETSANALGLGRQEDASGGRIEC